MLSGKKMENIMYIFISDDAWQTYRGNKQKHLSICVF